jgi:hypothetical protein
MKREFFSLLLLSFLFTISNAQSSKETTQDLSKAAKRGMLANAWWNDNGDIVLTYAMKMDKKSDQLNYEDYVFDKDLNFKGAKTGSQNKESYPDKERSVLRAFIGDKQRLNVERVQGTLVWNYKMQRYELGKEGSTEKVKLSKDVKYNGYSSVSTEDGLLVVASFDPEGRDVKEQFEVLFVDNDLNVKETPVTTGGNYSLVYFDELAPKGEGQPGNFFLIMAPKNKMPDLRQYVYAEFTPKGELVKRTNFNAPSSNTMVMDSRALNGDLYLIAVSTKSNDPYEDKFEDYATAGEQESKYEEAAFKRDMDNFHLLKFHDGELLFCGSTAIKNFDDKTVTPPGQRKSHGYDGKGLFIEALTVTPTGECFLGGQLMKKSFNWKTKEKILKYEDLVGFYFNNKGELKTQYAVEKMNDDTKSEIFSSIQSFVPGADGKTAYWEILEVKGGKGYASYWDAFNGNKTFFANYFPRVATIDLASGSLSDFTVMGGKGKFLVYKDHARLIDPSSNTVFYLGHDDDNEKIWLGKYEMK